jgi:hypothetical protein
MAEPVGTRQCSPLRFDERAEKRAALTEPASPLPAAQDMKRGHSTKEIWLRAKGEMPSFRISPHAGSTGEHTIMAYLRTSSTEPQQPRTAKEVIAANVKSLIEQLEAGHSEALTAYLNAMSRFHNYSFLC